MLENYEIPPLPAGIRERRLSEFSVSSTDNEETSRIIRKRKREGSPEEEDKPKLAGVEKKTEE